MAMNNILLECNSTRDKDITASSWHPAIECFGSQFAKLGNSQ